MSRLFRLAVAMIAASAGCFAQPALTALTVTKSFSPSMIALPTVTTTVNFTITNPNTVAVSNVIVTDTLSGLTANIGSVNFVCGSTAILASTGNTLTLSLPSLGAGASCSFNSITITADGAGVFNNITSPVTATGAPPGTPAAATLTVVQPGPTFTKAFSPNVIPVGGGSTLTFTITNNAAVAITGLAFTDTLPASVVVATPNGLTNSCGGTVTATAGSGSISLSGGTVSAPSGTTCTISLNVVGTVAGVDNNTTSTLTSTNALTTQPATATLTVALPPMITKSFADSQLEFPGPGDTTALSFTITNPNTFAMTGIIFFDNLPSGLIISTPNGLTGSCDGGTITAPAGTNSLSLAGATLAASTSCTFSVNVTATQIGVQVNTTSPITAFGGTIIGAPATASVSVANLFFQWFYSESGGGNP